MTMIVYQTNHCYEEGNHLAFLLEFVIAWLAIGGITSIFRLSTNPNACRKSFFHALIPFILAYAAKYIGNWIAYLRPYPLCVPWYLNPYGLPIIEIVWFESAFWVELMHGVFYIEEKDTWSGYIRVVGFVAIMAISPVFELMAGLATLTQIILSFLFSLLAIPMYTAIDYLHLQFIQWRYGKLE
jgi:hypothetical protein